MGEFVASVGSLVDPLVWREAQPGVSGAAVMRARSGEFAFEIYAS
jgi:hypothetical protein